MNTHKNRASTESKQLDASVKQAGLILASQYAELGVIFKQGLLKQEVAHLHWKTGCQPDGGIFLYEDKVIAFEAKWQGPVGNAIERYFKNLLLLQTFAEARDSELYYMTIAGGLGAKTVIADMLAGVTKGRHNQFNGAKPALYFAEDLLSIESAMDCYLLEALTC